MDVVWPVLGLVIIVIGLAGVFLPVLPGAPLIFVGMAVIAWSGDFGRISGFTVAFLGLLAMLSWSIDYVAASLGVQHVGASSLAVLGAIVGTVLGLFAGLVGVLLGPIIGATLGEWLARRDGVQATRAGFAAGLSFLLGIVAKIGIAFMMIGIFAVAWVV